jgi:saccharopine dehydrogenase-like NADP-dependent oxidoreductase
MKVLALGGCGGMGQFAVRTALEYEFVEKITIADVNLNAAKQFSLACGPKAVASHLDITDEKALSKYLSEHDVVLATVGPYYRFGVPVLKAAIKSGCHYIDICDDWEPTLEMLSLNDAARQAKITAVIGMGASPGLSNILALKAMGALDETESLITGWGQGSHKLDEMVESGSGGSYGAAYEHWFHQLTGTIRIRQDQVFCDVMPFQKKVIYFPGIGTSNTYTVGHPEPLTIPLMKPEITNCFNVMEFEASLIEIVRWICRRIDEGHLSLKQAADLFIKIEKKGLLSLLLSRAFPALLKGIWHELVFKRIPFPSLFAIATGKVQGENAVAGAFLKGLPYGGMSHENMGAATGVPAAAMLSLLYKRVNRYGVYAPEGIDGLDLILDEIAPLCTPSFKSGKELVSVVVESRPQE